MIDWSYELKRRTQNVDGCRPFICDGFPSDSDLLVIGENPTSAPGDWWSYWSQETGFDLARFMEAYRADRRANGYTGRKAEGTPTRWRLEIFRNEGFSVVESNVYMNAAPAGKGVDPKPNGGVLRLLLQNMPNLRAVVAHGKHAQRWLGRQGKIDVPIWKAPHLSRFVSLEGVRDWCENFRTSEQQAA